MRNLDSLPTARQKTEPLPYKLSQKTSEDQVARQDSRHRRPEKDRDAEYTYSYEIGTLKMDRPCYQNALWTFAKEHPQVGKRSHGGQKKRYKDTLKASLKDFNIPTESWEQIAQDRTKWRGLIKRGAGEYEAKKKSAKPSRNVHSGKPELRHHQQSFLPQTSLVLSATCSLELTLVSSAILEHTHNNTLHSSLGFVIVSNDRRTRIENQSGSKMALYTMSMFSNRKVLPPVQKYHTYSK